MKRFPARNIIARIIIFCVALFALAALSIARTPATTTSVNIVNNSTHEIRNIYLSHVDADDWGANQLSEGSTIAPGQSANLASLACDAQQVKVIAEDGDGCFLSMVAACGSDATWTITNDTARDCGN